MSDNNIKQDPCLIDGLKQDLERNYLSSKEQATWMMDWNMLLYSEEEESGFKLDWNKLIYNEEQLEEFNLQRQEKMIQPDRYEYLFNNPSERTPMEKIYLKQAGYDVEETECEEDNETIVKRLIVQNLLKEV